MSFFRTLQSLRIHNRKGVAVLIDPDKVHDESRMKAMAELLRHTEVTAVLIGGSLLTQDHFNQCLKLAKKHLELPLVLGLKLSSQRDPGLGLFLLPFRGFTLNSVLFLT